MFSVAEMKHSIGRLLRLLGALSPKSRRYFLVLGVSVLMLSSLVAWLSSPRDGALEWSYAFDRAGAIAKFSVPGGRITRIEQETRSGQVDRRQTTLRPDGS